MEYFFVYILRCSDNSYYTGHTDHIEKRISEHSNKKVSYTSGKLPFEVVYVETFTSREEALSAEFQIKKWSRKKKEALIKKNWKDLTYLSKKNFKK